MCYFHHQPCHLKIHVCFTILMNYFQCQSKFSMIFHSFFRQFLKPLLDRQMLRIGSRVTHFWGWSTVKWLERKTHCSGSERRPCATCCSVDGWAMCKPNFPLQLPGDASIGLLSSKADSGPARRAPPPLPYFDFSQHTICLQYIYYSFLF